MDSMNSKESPVGKNAYGRHGSGGGCEPQPVEGREGMHIHTMVHASLRRLRHWQPGRDTTCRNEAKISTQRTVMQDPSQGVKSRLVWKL